jgi:hypothetical protein
MRRASQGDHGLAEFSPNVPAGGEAVGGSQLPKARPLSLGNGDRVLVASFCGRKLVATKQEIAPKAVKLGFAPAAARTSQGCQRLIDQLRGFSKLTRFCESLGRQIAGKLDPA